MGAILRERPQSECLQSQKSIHFLNQAHNNGGEDFCFISLKKKTFFNHFFLLFILAVIGFYNTKGGSLYRPFIEWVRC
jgi:hypothetical protein